LPLPKDPFSRTSEVLLLEPAVDEAARHAKAAEAASTRGLNNTTNRRSPCAEGKGAVKIAGTQRRGVPFLFGAIANELAVELPSGR